MENLCKCTMCDTVMYDENPRVGATLLDSYVGITNMVQIEVDGDLFWGCPKCETDAYLIDL